METIRATDTMAPQASNAEASEAELVAAAKRGDRDSFEKLLAASASMLRGVVHRMIGHPDDAADLIQEAQVRAFTKIGSFRGESRFGTWLVSIATRLCLDHLRKQARWRPYSQKYAEQECASVPELRQEILDTVADPNFAFDAREHIAFCFTCVARSLPPMQEAAVILREVLAYTNREAAKILDVTESVLRHNLSAGRASMQDTFEGLCSLVNKQGVCYQCSGFRNTTPAERRGLEVVPLRAEDARLPGPDEADGGGEGDAVDRVDPADPTQARFRVRLSVVREHAFADGVSQPLHDLIFRRIRRLERAARAS